MASESDFSRNRDKSGSCAGLNVSVAAQSRSNITAPVLSNNTITGNVHIIHNAPGLSWHHLDSDRRPTSETRVLISKHKARICSEYQYVTEYNSLPGEHVLLSERFTQPLIIQRHRDQQEREEEIRSGGENLQQVLSSRSSQDADNLNSLFNPDGHGIRPSAVILQGNSGNGKSFAVQKIMLDWASDKLYKERFDVVFHLKCKDINHIPGTKSLAEILSYSCSLTSDEISQILLQHSLEKVLFIVDGFDELRITQDFCLMPPNTDLRHEGPAEFRLRALLKGYILPESSLLVTTRSTAADTLTNLLKFPQRFSEIMGFSEKGVKEYFQKFFQDEELFIKAYEYVRSNETLITACSIPVICWIICTVLRERFSKGSDLTSGLETTTSIYVDFVCTLLEHHSQGLSQPVPTLLRSLGQLAERGMLDTQVLFEEKSVNEMVSDPAGNPFLCKLLFKRRIHQETMFSFMHLSFQEFFTALYCVLLDEKPFQKKLTQLKDLKSIYSPPRYAAVLQFICGLLNKDVGRALNRKNVFIHPKIQEYLKKWILEDIRSSSSARALFVFNCLYELHEDSFVKVVMEQTEKIDLYAIVLRKTDLWALLYCCQCCQCLNELQMGEAELTSKKLYMILPIMPKFKSVRLFPVDLDNFILADLMCVLTRRQTLSSQSVYVYSYSGGNPANTLYLTISKEEFWFSISTMLGLEDHKELHSFSLTFQHFNALIHFDWRNIFQIVYRGNVDVLMTALHLLSGLQKMELRLGNMTKRWANRILSFSQTYTGLQEMSVHAEMLLEEGIKVLQKSRSNPGCTVTFTGKMRNKEIKHRESINQVKFRLSARGCFMETL
nr:NACHT, LRR and PYD domains-containing protein 3-like [Danio rerio]|eukprot:XP_005171463.3 NACHT, LRR and PYD domains-containing protein 3-like [Danio rerio]